MRLASDDERVRLSGIIAAFGLERAENVNAMIASLREGQGRIGGNAWIVQQDERFHAAGRSTSHAVRAHGFHLVRGCGRLSSRAVPGLGCCAGLCIGATA